MKDQLNPVSELSFAAIEGQQGAVLLLSMVLMLALTVIGVSSMQGTIFDEKMAGNSRDVNLAFQAAESGLRNGELWLFDQTSAPVADNTASAGVYAENALGTSSWWQGSSSTWWGSKAIAMSGVQGVAEQPTRIIEKDIFLSDSLDTGTQQVASGVNFYRVTSRATGARSNVVRQLQSIYARRF